MRSSWRCGRNSLALEKLPARAANLIIVAHLFGFQRQARLGAVAVLLHRRPGR
jgi:hypothetical protein